MNMENVKHVNFVSSGNIKRAIIYYGEPIKQIEVSHEVGEYIVRDYAKKHDIRNYEEFFAMDFISVYKANLKNKSLIELLPDGIIDKLIIKEKFQKYSHTDFDTVLFVEDKGKIYIDIVYKCYFEKNGKLKEKYVKDRVDLDEGIDLLINYAKENDIRIPKKLFDSLGNVRVQKSIRDIYQKEIYPKFKKGLGFLDITKNVRKIILFPIKEGNKTVVKAFVFYSNGSVTIVTKEEAKNILAQVADIYDVSKTSLKYNSNLDFYNFESQEEIIKNFDKYRAEAVFGNEYLIKYLNHIDEDSDKREKSSMEEIESVFSNDTNKKPNKIVNIFTKLKTKLTGSKLVKRIALFGTSLGVLCGAAAVGVNLVKNSMAGEVVASSGTVGNEGLGLDKHVPGNKSTYNDFSDCNFEELISNCRNNFTRECAVRKIHNFITSYNGEIADSHKEEGSSNKMVHTVDETVAMYLAYNDLSYDVINKIFETTKFNYDDLKNNFVSAQYQDALAHNIQKRSLGKWELFENQEDRDLYNKYEELFMEMNKSDDIEIKASYKEQFNNMVREDLSGMSTGDYTNVNGAKAVIKEFVEAMDNVNIEVSNPFTASERQYIDGIRINVVNKKLKDIAIKQSARNIEKFLETNVVPDIDPYFDNFKSAIVTDLTDKGAYNIKDDNRDVSVYKAFATNTNLGFEPINDNNEETVDFIFNKLENGKTTEFMTQKVFVK